MLRDRARHDWKRLKRRHAAALEAEDPAERALRHVRKYKKHPAVVGDRFPAGQALVPLVRGERQLQFDVRMVAAPLAELGQ